MSDALTHLVLHRIERKLDALVQKENILMADLSVDAQAIADAITAEDAVITEAIAELKAGGASPAAIASLEASLANIKASTTSLAGAETTPPAPAP